MERKFEEVMETIRNAEADVDKVLDAARLERHEGPPRYLSAEQNCDGKGRGPMTKAAALHQFFSSFGLPAYATTDVSDDAENQFRVVIF